MRLSKEQLDEIRPALVKAGLPEEGVKKVVETVLTWIRARDYFQRSKQIGKFSSQSAASRELGGYHGLVRDRLRNGWSEERAVSTPPVAKNKTIGKYESLRAAGKPLGGHKWLVANRLRQGWSEERALTTLSRLLKKTSRFRGVSKVWHNKFRAMQGSTVLGSFTSEVEAAKLYDAVALLTYGSKAKLNFPEDFR